VEELAMRFQIEKTRLSSSSDLWAAPNRITTHSEEAETVHQAARQFSSRQQCHLVSDLTTFGSESVVAAKEGEDLFLLRILRISSDERSV
jgi:hypothetical protein